MDRNTWCYITKVGRLKKVGKVGIREIPVLTNSGKAYKWSNGHAMVLINQDYKQTASYHSLYSFCTRVSKIIFFILCSVFQLDPCFYGGIYFFYWHFASCQALNLTTFICCSLFKPFRKTLKIAGWLVVLCAANHWPWKVFHPVP